MRLDRLVRADMYRDGGSLELEFTTENGEPYVLSLRASSIVGEYVTLSEVALADATFGAVRRLFALSMAKIPSPPTANTERAA